MSRLFRFAIGAIAVLGTGGSLRAGDAYRAASPFLRVGLSSAQPGLDLLAVDRLGLGKCEGNVLRPAGAATDFAVQAVSGDATKVAYRRRGASGDAMPDWTIEVGRRTIRMLSQFSPRGAPGAVVLDFDTARCHATLLGLLGKNGVELPAVLHLPGHGTFRVTGSGPLGYTSGNGFVKVTFPPATAVRPRAEYSLEVIEIHPEVAGIEEDARFHGFRRNWLNVFQLNPEFGVLSNHAASDTCGFCYYEYADIARYTPPLAENLSALDIMRQTLDRVLGGMKTYGMPGHGDFPEVSADTYPSLIIAACDCAAGDVGRRWLEKNYPGVRQWAENMLATDRQGNGLIKYDSVTGNSGSWNEGQPKKRPSNWWDTIGFGHEDAYANALAYRALRNMESMAGALHKADDAARYRAAAEKLKDAYLPAFYNPATGVLAGWRSADGQLHDYYFLFVNSIAIHYGLVPKDKANAIMDRLLEKMKAVGYTRFDLGLPGNLVSVARKDYVHKVRRFGGGRREDNADGFQIYENGGATGCFAYFTLAALYDLGRREEADHMLMPMLQAFEQGQFEGRGANGLSNDWRAWNGKPWGYEGFLVDNYYTLLAVLRHDTVAATGGMPGEIPQAIRRTASIVVEADQMPPRNTGCPPVSRYLTGACIEDVNHEIYGGLYSQMVFDESFQEPSVTPRKGSEVLGGNPCDVSGPWRPVQTGSAAGALTLETDRPFVGRQSQRMTYLESRGQIGVENQGLNRWGMHFAEGKPYEGVLWARADAPAELFVALENKDGSQTLAEEPLSIAPGQWRRLNFTLTSKATAMGRLAITLRKPGSIVLGYVFLQPGDWGRFRGLPVRRDVAEGLVDQGITVLRYGGSMVNHAEYRWKKMIGPRDRRPPYRGTWYPYSSNGWGILDFLDFCAAAGFAAIPDLNINETPQDMADFIDYVNGPSSNEWGRRRAADGHPEPYNLRHIELGNEERVDDQYFQKFKPLAEAIWARDPRITIVVGDFAYGQPIRDPFNFRGAASGITSLASQRQILQLARQKEREVWFDVHIGTEGPRPDFGGTTSYIDALDKLAEGARHRVVIFEFNAGNHDHRRALANAIAINTVERDGRIPIATSANCLQPDGQNDNGWNQGLLFLNPSQVWLQPPGYVTQMFSRNYQPHVVRCEVTGGKDAIDATAARSDDGRTLVLRTINPTDTAVIAQIRLSGFFPTKAAAQLTELSGSLEARNTAAQPLAVVPHQRQWRHEMLDGRTRYSFPPYSVTVIRFE